MTATEMEREVKAKTIVPPFGIEIDHPRNCDIVLQSIPGCRLRSRIKATTTTVDGKVRSPQNKGHSLPTVPGMQLHVNPAALSYVVLDPLNDDEEAKLQVRRFIQMTTGVRQENGFKGADTTKGELDRHRMKTLCREVCALLEEGVARVIKGPRPDRDDVDDLTGDYLLNPGLRTQTTQPMYEKDLPGWVDQLTRSGG